MGGRKERDRQKQTNKEEEIDEIGAADAHGKIGIAARDDWCVSVW